MLNDNKFYNSKSSGKNRSGRVAKSAATKSTSKPAAKSAKSGKSVGNKSANIKRGSTKSANIKLTATKNATKATGTKTLGKKTVVVGGVLTSKQRANLRAIASTLDPIYQIGKDGVNDAQLQGIGGALNKRELIKITVLKTSEFSAKELLDGLAQKLGAISVSAIGSKIILYKRSESDDVDHIVF